MLIYGLFALLVLCFIQDVRLRGIHWVIFPLLLVASVAFNFETLSLENIALNLAFLAVLFGGLTLYLFIRKGKLTDMTKGYFSWGDILFLLAILPLFEPMTFIYFFTVGTLLSLILFGLSNFIKRQKTIPYAGYMAVASMAYLLFQDQFNSLIQTHVHYY